ncbi:MAG: hypothetical protein KA436_01000 [Oligoflexales bacterium]|nr:hypothetical protein [Oligoflexales bacterium]
MGDSKLQHYLPIERFKSMDSILFQEFGGSVPHKTFLSSGTTQSIRSRSHFSERGLAFFKSASLKTFHSVMSYFFDDAGLHSAQGLSLVPPSSVWTDSSLAQMISWFGELWPLGHVEGAVSLASDIERITAGGKKIWLFGTAFHFVQILDQLEGRKLILPEGSVIFETGGTKGKTREIGREDLYTALSETFGVSKQRVVSEYSMCEMASQAYDFYDATVNSRRFLFPYWVKVGVLVGSGRVDSSGEGCLTLFDPARIDYPWPLRVQDLIRLDAEGGFTLLGRLPQAPLKGCSLNVEEI